MMASYNLKGGVFRGRDEIDRTAGVIKATRPDCEYQPLFTPEELGDAGRVRGVSGTPGKPPAYAGTDFIVARNGRTASVYLFFDNLPLDNMRDLDGIEYCVSICSTLRCSRSRI
jgi:hypothetical protein